MRKPSWYDFINDALGNVEWFFARRWLNKTFGYKEYWGDYIAEKLHQDRLNKN